MSRAHETYQKLKLICSGSVKHDLLLASYLYDMRRYDLWRDSVGGIDSWADFLKQPEINIPMSKANRLIRVHEYFVVGGLPGVDISGIPLSKLDYIARKGKSGRTLELLEAARELSSADFKELLHDVTNGKEGEEAERTYEYMVMRRCIETGSLTKVHEVASDDIKQSFNLE